jgi:hypothetical protein
MSLGSLDQIAVLQATDKSSVEHDYARHYEHAFQKFRGEPIELLEIGVASGASLRMWESFFSAATVIGVDIIADCERYAGGRKRVEIGSQFDDSFLASLKEKYSPTIIIDDGSHQAEHVIFTFEHLFDAVRPGGCYVIEDLYDHVDRKDSPVPTGPLKMSLELAFMATTGNFYVPDILPGLSDAVIRTIDRVEFIKHAAFIWKKPAEDTQQQIADMTALVERSESASNWFFLVHYIIQKGGSLADAAFAARKSIALGDTTGIGYWRLSEVLESDGDYTGALVAAQEAMKLNPNSEIASRINRLKIIALP